MVARGCVIKAALASKCIRLLVTVFRARCQPVRLCSVASKKLPNVNLPGKPRRPPGGGRFLIDSSRVFEYNNWDNVEWDDEQQNEAERKVNENSQQKVSTELQKDYEENADRYWNDFYDQHQNRFFKDRHWLITEFPELAPPPQASSDVASADYSLSAVDSVILPNLSSTTDALSSETCPTEQSCNDSVEELSFPGARASTRILEVGCGVGNTVIPILRTNDDPGLFVYGCDLSSTAVQLLREHAEYDASRCHAFVGDISDTDCQLPFPQSSIDIIICIFVLSAIHPDKNRSVEFRLPSLAVRLAGLLKPGGLIVFRDYGRYDLTQLRFKKGRCLGENFYARGDGTKVYFFTQDELRSLFVAGAGLVEEQNLIDRRLQVNRGRQVKMYRVWVQCKFRKPASAAAALPGSAAS